MSAPAIALFTRDLRLHDNPTLVEAARGGRPVVPLFVFDEHILGSDFAVPNRLGFLLESPAELDAALTALGAGLVVRRGDPTRETLAVAREAGATTIVTSADVTGYAQARRQRMAGACERERIDLMTPDAVTVLGREVRQHDGGHYEVFTPYYRRWAQMPRREVVAPPRRLTPVPSVAAGRLPGLTARARARKPLARRGGRRRGRGPAAHEGLAASGPRRLRGRGPRRPGRRQHLAPVPVPSLRLPLGAGTRGGGSCDRHGAGGGLRPSGRVARLLSPADGRPARQPPPRYRPRGDRWQRDEEHFAAWREGRTGYPIVDAGMRQLAREGWMHNRARLVTASFLTKNMYIDWRLGARHYFDLLLDGDVANNVGNWQWVAGTGVDPRPYRIFNPLRQAERFDPRGDYVRRYVPELGGVEGSAVHQPWRLGPLEQQALEYPDRIIDHEEGARRFRAVREQARERSG